MVNYIYKLDNGDAIHCYGVAELGANYALTFDDEMLDGIACDIEASSWAGVIKQLKRSGHLYRGLSQIEAC
jgi:hypothetical protein